MSELALFDDFFGFPTAYYQLAHPRSAGGKHASAQNSALALPRMSCDFIENKDNFELHADLPGYNKDDIQLQIHDGVLSLEAHKENTTTEEKPNYYFQERSYGKVCRSFRLPATANGDGAAVTYTDGVLKVTFPKQEKPGAKKLAIA